MADFAEHYSIRLHGSGMRWPEFAHLVAGLMGCESRFRQIFAPPEAPDQSDGIDEE